MLPGLLCGARVPRRRAADLPLCAFCAPPSRVPLPRSPSVSQILDEFCQAKARRTSHERLYTEIRAGVAAYFNQARAQRLSPLLSDSPVSVCPLPRG